MADPQEFNNIKPPLTHLVFANKALRLSYLLG